MNLSSLEYFVTIADCGSYTKAAQQLFVTQPALSRQISALEEELGEKVFVRKNKSLELTPAGAVCLKEARHIVELCSSLQSKVHHISGELNVAYSTGMTVLAAVLDSFYSVYQDIDLKLLCVKPSRLPSLLGEGKADFVISMDAAFAGVSGIDMVPLSCEEVCVFVPTTHALASREAVSIGELASEKFVMAERSVGPEGVDYTVKLCAGFGFRPDAACYVDDMESALYMVGSGRGIAIAVSYAGNLHIPGVKCLRVAEPLDPMKLVLVSKSYTSNPVVPVLMRTVRKRFS